MGIKVSNDISSERTHQICSQMSCRVSTKAVKRIVKFESLHFVAFFFCCSYFFWQFNMVVNGKL